VLSFAPQIIAHLPEDLDPRFAGVDAKLSALSALMRRKETSVAGSPSS
jgi:hypothetical protein